MKFRRGRDGDIPPAGEAKPLEQSGNIGRPFGEDAVGGAELVQVSQDIVKNLLVDSEFLPALELRFTHPDLLGVHPGDLFTEWEPVLCAQTHVFAEEIVYLEVV